MVAAGRPKRFEVYSVAPDPTVGSEIKKSRPCVVISPDEMNRHLRTVLVAPMTTKGRVYPTRVACRFQGKTERVVLDQIQTVDVERLTKYLGTLSSVTQDAVSTVLAEMFAP